MAQDVGDVAVADRPQVGVVNLVRQWKKPARVVCEGARGGGGGGSASSGELIARGTKIRSMQGAMPDAKGKTWKAWVVAVVIGGGMRAWHYPGTHQK